MNRVLFLSASIFFSLALPLHIAPVQASANYAAETASDEAELALWGIKNGCLSSDLVRHFYVLNSHAAVIELVGGKRVLMRFHGDCQGVEQYGFVHTAHNNRVCPRTNAIRVLQTGTRCEVESLEPYQIDN
ncbi:MAG: hypothetical protein EP334_08680 [Gammaproteobacteria bacterium]|nr:MAG: hypothetical protein EP334_08680 [Gammaproteobacteria bacterium]